MSLYETLRHFADSYGLIVMFVMFSVLCLWPFRPGSAARNKAAANSIFEEDSDGQ